MERTPVEVWKKILTLLLRTPFLPREDATFAQDIAMFSDTCDSDRISREFAQVECRLRLVCRSWNCVVQKIQVKPVHCNTDPWGEPYAPAHVLPSLLIDGETRPEILKAKRLEIWLPLQLSCPTDKVCHSALSKLEHQLMLDARDWSHRFDSANMFYVAQDLDNLEVLLPGFPLDRKFPKGFIDRLPNLKIMHWSHEWIQYHLTDIVQHPINQTLTYLRIELTWEDIRGTKRPIFFPNLRFLRIHITEAESGQILKKPGDSLVTWARFPQLQRLWLALDLAYPQMDETVSFLKAVGANLIGLILDIPWGSPAWFMHDLWNYLPSLIDFGFGYSMMGSIPPPPAIVKPVNLVYRLMTCTSLYGTPNIGRRFTPLGEFFLACKMWRIKQLKMIESWHEAGDVVANINPHEERVERELGLSLAFYECAHALGVEICDRDDVQVTEPAGKLFLEILKQYECKGYLKYYQMLALLA